MSLEKERKCSRQNCEGLMHLQDDVYALTVVKKAEDGNAAFIPSRGMPVKAYVCDHCGVVDLYAAVPTGEF